MKSQYYRPDRDTTRSSDSESRLAHAYVPFQRYSDKYSLEEALSKGTLFPELWMPYKRGPRGYY